MKKETVKSAINIAALILVPLINERHRIKDHDEVKKATDFSLKAFDYTKQKAAQTKDIAVRTTDHVVNTAHFVKDSTIGSTQFINQKAVDSKKKYRYNKQMKQHIKQEKLEEKEAHKTQKQIEKMDKQLSKNIASREQIEAKEAQSRKRSMKKEMKYYDKHQEINNHSSNNIKFNRKDKKAINQLNQRLENAIKERHAYEYKSRDAVQKSMIKEMKRYKNYKIKTPKQRSFFGRKQKVDTVPTMTNSVYTNTEFNQKKDIQKSKVHATHVEDNYDNAQRFEQHRKMMANHIAKR
ncbi:hypothetical protein [Macrococcoides caseolyticum]|uniref:hypothetical protein n=1 Tax=Macrococcoides caseolyticum TaxID=69966 RepID=UPI001F4852ED|nr:hypothetical protein [Macrococcus caseolyticus]MCE4955909.1 hypothetical protein [Macrococcus caseolyticus]